RYTFKITAPNVTAPTKFHESFEQLGGSAPTWYGPGAAIDITVSPRAPRPPGTPNRRVACAPADATVWLSRAEDGLGVELGSSGSQAAPAGFSGAAGSALVTLVKPGLGSETTRVTLSDTRVTTVSLTLGRPRFASYTTGVALNAAVSARAIPVVADLDGDGL